MLKEFTITLNLGEILALYKSLKRLPPEFKSHSEELKNDLRGIIINHVNP